MTGAHANVESRWERTKWQIKEALGIAPEDQDLETEGMWDRARGSVEEFRDATGQRDHDG